MNHSTAMERNCLSPRTGHWPNASTAYEDHCAELRCEETGKISIDEPIDRDTV
jgi:hypothetical protein